MVYPSSHRAERPVASAKEQSDEDRNAEAKKITIAKAIAVRRARSMHVLREYLRLRSKDLVSCAARELWSMYTVVRVYSSPVVLWFVCPVVGLAHGLCGLFWLVCPVAFVVCSGLCGY